MNRICLSGRITKDLELRKTSTGKEVVSYTLAVRRDKNNTDFINCVTFGEFANVLCKYCQKGDMIGVEGRLQVSSYTDSEGNTRYSHDVITDKVDFYNTKQEENKDGKSTPKSVDSIKQDELVLSDEDLPF